MTSADTKQALRQQAKQRRDSTADDGLDFAAELSQRAPQLLALSPTPIVSAYIAIGSELDPAPLIASLTDGGAIIALPVMTAKDAPLEFRAWAPGAPLVDRMWGIKEPGPKCAVVDPDILLVPLLLVDSAGNRLGYGGGFYDRTISALRARKNIIAIGVALPAQRVDAVPHEAYDEPLDYVLTPSALEKF